MTRFNKRILMLSLTVAGTIFAACNEQYHTENYTNQEPAPPTVGAYRAPAFAEPNEAKKLDGTPAENLKALFEATGSKVITSMGRMDIKDDEFQEIAKFTSDSIVKEQSTQTEKYREIFRWIRENITYEMSDPRPYAVFKNKKCVCQGYANLLTVMCHSQGIPTVVVNGYLDPYGGHAWNYTCPDGVWEVSDPTNGGSSPMSDPSKYKILTPWEADVNLFSDDHATYRYYDRCLNVHEVKSTASVLVVPYSVGGFVISSFNPFALPKSVTEIYLGENITTLGSPEDNNMNLVIIEGIDDNIRAIHVDEANTKLSSHKGIVYRKNGYNEQLYYIPGGMESIELLPMEVVDKNTIYNHAKVKEIYFPEGTKKISNFAIENCPELERVYVPVGAEYSRNMLFQCPATVEIIEGEPSGIKHVTM